jgi:Cu2+-exporting ATPase
MVGDGLNDAPALGAADFPMAPGSDADIGRHAADLVFLREDLSAVPQAVAIAREAAPLVRQNFGLAIAYNFVAIPLAILGLVTPLVAATRDVAVICPIVVANVPRLPGSRARASRDTQPAPAGFASPSIAGAAK